MAQEFIAYGVADRPDSAGQFTATVLVPLEIRGSTELVREATRGEGYLVGGEVVDLDPLEEELKPPARSSGGSLYSPTPTPIAAAQKFIAKWVGSVVPGNPVEPAGPTGQIVEATDARSLALVIVEEADGREISWHRDGLAVEKIQDVDALARGIEAGDAERLLVGDQEGDGYAVELQTFEPDDQPGRGSERIELEGEVVDPRLEASR